jgi:hypothetical protein
MAARKGSAVTALAGRLVRQLEALRGGEGYPPTLQRLAELTGSPGPDTVKAAGTKAFADRAVLGKPKDLAAPVALREDLPQLAASPQLLLYALDRVCTPNKPTTTVAGLKTKVEKALREPFLASVNDRVQGGNLPAGVAVVTVGRARHLHLTKYPLPDPPEVRLANDLARVLEAQRQLGDSAYPVRQGRLVELTDPKATKTVVNKAVKTAAFRSAAGPLFAKGDLLALNGDRERLAGDAEFLLRSLRPGVHKALTVEALSKAVAPDLRTHAADVLRNQLATQSLPPTVGWIWVGKKQHLFLLEDVHTSRPRPVTPPAPLAPPTDFARRFDDVFERLNREKGSHNFVSLVDLRRALPMDRAAFDAALHELRRAGRYTLSAAEGRHGLTADERAAGIPEQGMLLLYVSRRTP